MDARDSVLLNHQIFEVDCPKIEFPPMDLWMPREIVLVIENTSGDSAICDLKLDHSHTLGQIECRRCAISTYVILKKDLNILFH